LLASILIAAILASLFVATLGSGSAQASSTYKLIGEFGTADLPAGGSGGAPRTVVDEVTGDILVAAPEGFAVFVFSPAGTLVATIPGSPTAIAIDQSNGDVYLSDPATGSAIDRYTTDRASPPTYTLDNTYTGPVAGSDAAAGEVAAAAGLAIDQASGDLLVADAGNVQVSRFDSSGTFLGAFAGDGSEGGAFTSLLDIAVDSNGRIYVVQNGLVDSNYGRALGSLVQRFAADGTQGELLEAPQGLDEARAVGVDPASQRVVVATGGGFGAQPLTLQIFDDLEFTGSGLYSELARGGVTSGLWIDGTSGHLFTATGHVYGGQSGLEVFEPALLPDVIMDPPSAITRFGAHFAGTVNPLGKATSYRFEYSKDAGATWLPVSAAEIPGGAAPGEVPVPVSADPALEPNTHYEARLWAGNADGSSMSPTFSFDTPVSAPAVVTGAVSDRTLTGASLYGTVNPFGVQTSYRFEYGVTTAYGSRAPLAYEAVAGASRQPRTVTQPVAGLQPGTTYHYRLVAENSVGVEAGEDRTFTTTTVENSLHRAYEMVSPADKQNGDVDYLYFQASPDGNAMAFQTRVGFGEAGSAAPLFRQFLSQRTTDDWLPTGIDPPQYRTHSFGAGIFSYTEGISQDGSRAVVLSNKAMAPGSVDEHTNTYLYDVKTDTYKTLTSVPGEEFYSVLVFSGNSDHELVGGTPNFDRILLNGAQAGVPLLPGTPQRGLYEYRDGQLTLASREPDGTPIPAQLDFLRTDQSGHYVPGFMSEDGSRVFFKSEGVASAHPSAVYARVDGTSRIISKSHRAEDAGAIRAARFAGASRDGRTAYIFSQDLTEDSQPGVESLYRYDTESDTLTLLTAIPSSGIRTEALQVSESGGSVYFWRVSDAIYDWHDGELSRIPDSSFVRRFDTSPDGSFFVFQIEDKSAHRYSEDEDRNACVSCLPDGSDANVDLGEYQIDAGGGPPPRVVTDSGQVFFNTASQMVYADTNSVQDVYEYDGTETRLISTGDGLGSELGSVSADGRDVFFITKDRLVGRDTDGATDVYDARVGGGLASQNPPPIREECIRDDCKATPKVGPELPFGGSEALSGPENIREVPRKRCGKGRHVRKVKGKSRCVRQQKSRTNHNRRQGR
jgi:WD40 repeat protein